MALIPLFNYRVQELKKMIAAAVIFSCCTNGAVYLNNSFRKTKLEHPFKNYVIEDRDFPNPPQIFNSFSLTTVSVMVPRMMKTETTIERIMVMMKTETIRMIAVSHHRITK